MDGHPAFLDSRIRGNDGRVDPAEAVYEFVRSIPPARVVTYGQVAGSIEGVSLTPRQVGGIMHNAPPDVPWQRVVGAGGKLPIGKKSPDMMLRQRQLLRDEGVEFDDDNFIVMANHNWPMCDEEDLHGVFDAPTAAAPRDSPFRGLGGKG